MRGTVDSSLPTCFAACSERAGHEIFLADVALVDVLDLDASDRADLLGTLADALAQRFGKARIVEDADAAQLQKARHPTGATRSGHPKTARGSGGLAQGT